MSQSCWFRQRYTREASLPQAEAAWRDKKGLSWGWLEECLELLTQALRCMVDGVVSVEMLDSVSHAVFHSFL